MKLLERNTCVVTGSDLNEIFTFKQFPIKASCEISQDNSLDLFSDMSFCFGNDKSSTVQLNRLIPLEILYSNYTSVEKCGNIWKNCFRTFSNFIKENCENVGDVLEIGGTDSIVNHFITETEQKYSSWNIINTSDELLPEPIRNKVNVICDIFENVPLDITYDTIIHSHLMEHVYNPLEFLKKVFLSLTDNGSHFICIPNMKYWLENNYSNTLFFEHTFFLDLSIVEILLNKIGFQILNYREDTHSMYIHCKKSNQLNVPKNIDTSYILTLFNNYIEFILNYSKFIIDNIKSDESVFIFGAHIPTQILLNLGLSENNIVCILDNNSTKQSKRLYGTNLLVHSPEIISTYSNPKIILSNNIYSSEIKEQLLGINTGCVFL